MHPFDAASFLSSTPAEGRSCEPPQQQQQEELVGGAASSPPSPSPSRATRGGGDNAGVRCQDCLHRPKAYCAHCRSDRGLCPGGHVNTSHVPASSQQRSERQQTLAVAASAPSTASVDVEPVPNKRPRRTALPPVAAATTTSSVDHQPIATTTAAPAQEGFAREVSMDAVFRRVRIGGPAEMEVAYYTTVTIAGHVFRGVLYDVGPGPGPGPGPHNGGSSTDTAAASDTDGSSGEVGSSLSTAGGSSCLDLALGLGM